jgi:hypothetical protein
MKQFKLFSILFFIFFSTLYAYDLSDIQDTNVTCQINRTTEIPIPKKRKNTETKYEKMERKLSEYRGTWFKDMMIYSADMFIPDEMVRAVKDVMENRQDEGFGDKTEKVPQILANDSYNTVLTTAYYYMQDMARITERMWKDEACKPEHFEYDMAKEPKEILLDLSECDARARGVTEEGIVLPLNENFPTALYPYASKPDGCSAEGLQDLYDQSNDIFNDDKWLTEACNLHDQCYYTEGTTAKECNSQFIVKMVDSCNNIKVKDTVQYLGIKNTVCGMKGLLVATGANACARRYFEHAQKKQRAYNQWVQRYEKRYREVEQQLLQEKGQ